MLDGHNVLPASCDIENALESRLHATADAETRRVAISIMPSEGKNNTTFRCFRSAPLSVRRTRRQWNPPRVSCKLAAILTDEMGKITLLIVAAGMCGLAAATADTQMSAREVSQAIARAGKAASPPVCVGRSVAGDFMVCIQGPEQRIEAAALLAKQNHRRFKAEDVPDEMKARTWFVIVRPNQPGLVDGRPVRTPEAESLQVLPANQPEATPIAPLNVMRVPYSWDNAVGVTLRSQGLTALIDSTILPSGSLEFVVRTESGPERRYVLSETDRAHVR
jgi:hypothetical protein